MLNNSEMRARKQYRSTYTLPAADLRNYSQRLSGKTLSAITEQLRKGTLKRVAWGPTP